MKIDQGTNELHIQCNENRIEQISRIIILDTTILSLFSVVMLATTLMAIAALNQLDTDLGERDRDQNINSVQVARVRPELSRPFTLLAGIHNFALKSDVLNSTSDRFVYNAGPIRSSGVASGPFSPLRVGKSEPKTGGAGQNFTGAAAKFGNKCLTQQSTANYMAQLPTSAAGSADTLRSLGSESWPNTSDLFDAYVMSTIY